MAGKSRAIVVLVALVALGVFATGATAKPSGSGPGNSLNAKSCQNGGWQNLARSDGTAFSSEDECTAYAAQGGQLQPKQPASQQICQNAGGTYQTGGIDLYGGADLFVCTVSSSALQDAVYWPLSDACTAEGGSVYFVYADIAAGIHELICRV